MRVSNSATIRWLKVLKAALSGGDQGATHDAGGDQGGKGDPKGRVEAQATAGDPRGGLPPRVAR